MDKLSGGDNIRCINYICKGTFSVGFRKDLRSPVGAQETDKQRERLRVKPSDRIIWQKGMRNIHNSCFSV